MFSSLFFFAASTGHDAAAHAAAAGGFLVVTAELLLKDAVLETQLLFLAESHGVFALFLAACAHSVLAWREVAALERFGWTEE
jgi:hypothetical protein